MELFLPHFSVKTIDVASQSECKTLAGILPSGSFNSQEQ